MKRLSVTLLLAATFAAGAAQAGPVDVLLDEYRASGAGPFDAATGQSLWTREQSQGRSCASCHTENLKAEGEHARTGKTIEPLAPSVNPARLSEKREIQKWLYRNCKWTVGRECTPQEKGDYLTFIRNQ